MTRYADKIVEIQDYIRRDIDYGSSEVHERIFKHVNALYPDAEQEVIIDGFYKADLFIPKNKTVIEV